MKNLQLVLTNPCSKQWDDMEKVSVGRHCDRCEKNVYDLTTKSDAELLQFFKRKKDNICGRLLSSQLNRTLNLSSPNKNWHWMLPLAAGVVSIAPAQAQNAKPVIMHSAEIQPSISPQTRLNAQSNVLQSILSGKVIDSLTGKPLSGVKIRQKDFKNVLAITDSTGKFELNILSADISKRFVFELNGNVQTEAYLKDDMIFKLTVDRVIRLGGVSALPLNRIQLYIIYSGKRKCAIEPSKMADISSDWIEKIDVIKDGKAIEVYGAKAANGVILIGIKKEYADRIDFSKKE